MDRVMLTWIWDVLHLAVSSYSVCPPTREISPTNSTQPGTVHDRQLHPLHTSLLSHISCIAPLAYLQRFSSSVQLTKRILAYKFTPLVVNNSRYNVTVTPIQGLNSSNYSEFKCRAGGATCANSPIFLHQEMGDVRVVPTQKRYVLCTHQRIEKANSAAEPPPFHRTVKIKDFHLMKHFKANLSAIERSNMCRFRATPSSYMYLFTCSLSCPALKSMTS